ncbi:GtrA family protein [Pseudomonas sp. Marseille-Q1929]|uniref:GtrA family protein n=1 Tax=Pseudomonas sp. Marseille-Q1929 TaxID=2730402 RepID=UPI001A8F623C|nr:GtrA family protein [Pseudomonas sp. Marseille-Q1929]MBO0491533.1 GtrA family protein [Pseudomonas sp. Marseille-Q1929]
MQKTLRLFIRYLGVGLIATSVHWLVFACLLGYLGPARSTFCGGFTGALVAYWLSRHWVFTQRTCKTRRFAITAASQVIANTLVVALLTQWGVPPHLAQLTAMAAVTFQGFMFNHFWVFQHDIKREPFQ